MKTILAFCVLFGAGTALGAEFAQARVTLKAERIQLIQAASAICGQAGLTFGWNRSVYNCGPDAEQRVSVTVEEVSGEEALKAITAGTPVLYRMEGPKVWLELRKPRPKAEDAQAALRTRVTLRKPYPSGEHRISLQMAVQTMIGQAGLFYDYSGSAKNLGDLARRFTEPSIVNQPLGEALSAFLAPYGLGYRVKGKTVVIVREDFGARRLPAVPKTPPPEMATQSEGVRFGNVSVHASSLGGSEVIGEVTNSGGRERTLLVCRAAAYDGDGNLLDTTSFIVVNLKAEQTRAFKVWMENADPAKTARATVCFESGD